MSKRTEKIQVMLSEDELELITSWQFDNRLPTRAAAIRALIGRSIDTEIEGADSVLPSREIGVAKSAIARHGKPSFTIADARAKDLPLIYVSDGFTELCEYEFGEITGKNCRLLQGSKTDPKAVSVIRERLRNFQKVKIDLVNYRKSGSAYNVRVEIEPVFANGETKPIVFVGAQTFLGDL